MSERIVKLLIESFPKILLPGLKMTIPLTVIAFSIAMVIAVIAAMIQYARVPVLRQIMRFYVWVVRGTPLLVQLFVVFYGLPSLGIILDPFPAAVIVFSINEGAYCAETMRAALESVPVGQMEAGYCVGMSYLQVMRRIAAAGAAHGVPAAVEQPDCYGEGYVAGGEHYRDGNVHGDAEARGVLLRADGALYRSRRDLPDFLHGADVGAALGREEAQRVWRTEGVMRDGDAGNQSPAKEIRDDRGAAGCQPVRQQGRRRGDSGTERVGQDDAAALRELSGTRGRERIAL